MKPHSLATIIIRFIALYFILAGIFSTLGSKLLSLTFSSASPFEAGPIQVQQTMITGVFGIQLAFGILSVIAGILLCVWSLPLGKLIARGLE